MNSQIYIKILLRDKNSGMFLSSWGDYYGRSRSMLEAIQYDTESAAQKVQNLKHRPGLNAQTKGLMDVCDLEQVRVRITIEEA